VAVDGLPTPQQQDLSWLRSGGRGSGGARLIAKLILVGAGMVAAVLLLVFVLHQVNGGETETEHLISTLYQIHDPWAHDLASDVTSYRTWIEKHGIGAELSLFDDISGFLLRSVLTTDGSPDESLFTAIFVSIHEGLIRFSFLIIASLRLWIVTCMLTFYFGYTMLKPYRGDDILGQTGNGRVFYSGARGGLEHLSASGAPDVLVRGLACPAEASRAEVHASTLWKTLGQFNAQTQTNESLIAIILKHGQTAPFVARFEEEGILAKTYTGAMLKGYVHEVLKVVLQLHADYARGSVGDAGTLPPQKSSMDEGDYAKLLHASLNRVLLPELKELVGKLPVHEVATFLLALESGKVLAHSFEGGKWTRKSNFPQLSARAVLHSVLAYPEEYEFEARHRIRHALVYASRSSSFAAVRMPQGMEPAAWALRQWAEVLLACPHEARDVVDEVELVGLTRAMHHIWETEVLPRVSSIVPDLTTTCYTTISNLFFVPLGTLVTLLRKTVSEGQLARLSELSASVSARQKALYDKVNQGDDTGIAARTFDRVLSPLTDQEIASLTEQHGLQASELREWSAMRNILVSHGWLARRVGDYTVPESSVIFSVFKAPSGYPAANALGFFGKSGLVPLRGGKFSEVWGQMWDSRFQSFQRATMSETKEEFEKQMKGIKEDSKEEEGSILAPSIG
jgi:hypothetical protein